MLKVTLYGKPSYAYSIINKAITQVKHSADLNLELVEIEDTETIVAKGIGKIPAVGLGEEEHSIDEATVQDFKEGIILKILQAADYGSLQRIIVPLDNSSSSLNALVFARMIAEQNGGIVTAINFLDTSSRFYNRPNQITVQSVVAPIQKAVSDKFSTNIQSLRTAKSDLPIEPIFLTSDPLETIIELSNARPNNLLILGYHPEHHILEGIEFRDLPKVACPVLLLPVSWEPQEIKNILYYAESTLPSSSTDEIKLEDPKFLSNGPMQKATNGIIKSTWFPSTNSKKDFFPDNKELTALKNYCINTEVDMLVINRRREPLKKENNYIRLSEVFLLEIGCPLLLRS